jgi:hypothetical protein
VSLERLNLVEVSSLTLREAVLSVKLKLGNNNRVKTPAMHVKGSFTKDEGSGVRDSRSSSGSFGITVLEKTRSSDDSIVSSSRTECGKRVGKSINGISVVERLGTHTVEKKTVSAQRSAVVNVFVRLDNPNKFLTGMVEVELDLVGRRTDRFITSELKLFNEVFMGVLCHSATFISVKEDVINVKRSSDKGLVVSSGILLSGGS